MPASQVCHKFFSQSLNSIHQYRKNALLDMTVALTRGASLSLTSIGRYLPGPARVKHKIIRDEKSERYGLGLRASKSRGEKRISVLCLVAVLYSIILWLTGYYLESKGINRWFQANSEKSRRVLSYLTLSENVIRQSPGLLSGMNPDRVYADMARAYRNIIMVY